MLPAKDCLTCGTEFVPKRKGTKYCDRKCQKRSTNNSARTTGRRQFRLSFVGVDGEGVDRPDGTHEYVMLSVGAETLWRNGSELELGDILSFLWQRYTENPDAAFVGFYLSYDFNHWFKHLPEDKARLLFTTKGIMERKSTNPNSKLPLPHPVVWEGWELDIMAGRRVRLRPHTCKPSLWTGSCKNRICGKAVAIDEPMDRRPPVTVGDFKGKSTIWEGSYRDFWKRFEPATTDGWMYVCDTGPFWQSSFLTAIDPEKWPEPVCSEEEYATIVRGKADRGTRAERRDTTYHHDMQMYNVLENEILSRITQRLNEGFMNEDITIQLRKDDWYGPGRAAQMWMDMLHNRIADRDATLANRGLTQGQHRSNEMGIKNADVYMSMPTWFYDAARASYYGGWFEQFMHGHIGNVWEYDINSAYPFIIASLSCLHTGNGHDGKYSRGTSDKDIPDNGYTLLYGTVRGSNQYVGAAPYRTSKGSILRPHITRGWYWKHEIEAAKRAGLVDTVDVNEWVSYQACTCSPPFNPDDIGISRMYALRLQVGKDSPQGKGFKLVYNSAYGKTAQSIGTPKYSNPVYASLITAGCRTLILDAIASHPDGARAVAMVATDGVYFTSCHPRLTRSKTLLGAWDEQKKIGMTQFMPGVYWTDDTREKIARNETPSLKSRGVNAKDLARQINNLDLLFARCHTALGSGQTYEWPELEFKVSFLLDSCKLALARGKWETAGRVTHGTARNISSNPGSKRVPLPFLDNETGVIRTHVYAEGTDGIDTTPYPKYFGHYSDPMSDGFFGDRIGREGDDGLQYFRDLMST